MSRFFHWILLTAGLWLARTANGQDSLHQHLDEVIYTAHKYGKHSSETGKVVTVIDRDQLERSSGRSLAEVLNQASGTTVIGSNSNPGTNLNLSIRGSSAGNVLVLVNGIPVNDPSVLTNYFDLNFISVDQIERVEILKGGHSTLYGSDAVAGVINIITRKAPEQGWHPRFGLSAGSYGTVRTHAGIGLGGSKTSLSLQYGYQRSDGFSSSRDTTGKAGYDRDPLQQHNITAGWRVELAPGLQANVNGQYSQYTAGLDAAAFSDERDHTVGNSDLQGGLGLVYTRGDLSLHGNYRYNKVDRHYLNDSIHNAPNFLEEDYAGRSHFAELYGAFRGKHLEFLAGLDFRANRISIQSLSVSAFGPWESSLPDSLAHMQQWSPYASVTLKTKDKYYLELGGRWNRHSLYGSNLSYTLNPSVLLGKWKLFANFYSAFKAPTLYQLFNPFAGNRELKPEESFNIEGGLQWYWSDHGFARAVWFYRDTRDAIEYIYTDPQNFIAQYVNAVRRKASGLELEFRHRGERWDLGGNFTAMRGRLYGTFDNTGFPLGKDTVSDNIFRNPTRVLNLQTGYRCTAKWYTQLGLRVAGKRLEPVYGGKPVQLSPYYTVDFYTEYRLSSRMLAWADLRNLTDQQYFELWGYNTRGFNLMAGVKIDL